MDQLNKKRKNSSSSSSSSSASSSSNISVLENKEDVYKPSILIKHVEINIVDLTDEQENFILQILKDRYEGKCIEEGYVERDSITKDGMIISAGVIKTSTILYTVQFACQICVLAENMILKCKVFETMTVGIQAIATFQPSPFIVMIYKNLHSLTSGGVTPQIGNEIIVKVLHTSSEINSPFIKVIADIVV